MKQPREVKRIAHTLLTLGLEYKTSSSVEGQHSSPLLCLKSVSPTVASHFLNLRATEQERRSYAPHLHLLDSFKLFLGQEPIFKYLL